MMITTLATFLFTAMLATAVLSLVWDLTRELADPDMIDSRNALRGVRAEAARIAALPRARQPLKVIGRAARPAVAPIPVLAPVRRPAQPQLAAAA